MDSGDKNQIFFYLIILFVVYMILDKVLGWSKEKEEKKEREEIKEKQEIVVTSDLAKLINRGIKPSFSATYYANLANGIHAAMDQFGTDEFLLAKNLLQLQNDADFLVVQHVFGTRDGKSLVPYIVSETSPGFRADISKRWAEKGITFNI